MEENTDLEPIIDDEKDLIVVEKHESAITACLQKDSAM
jgi:hypothetical protein